MKIQIVIVNKMLVRVAFILVSFISFNLVVGQNIEFRKFNNSDNRDTIYLKGINRNDEFSFLVIDTISGTDSSVLNNANLNKLNLIVKNELYNPRVKGFVYYYNEIKFDPRTVCVLRGMVKFGKKKTVDLKGGAPPWIFIIPNSSGIYNDKFDENILKPREPFRNNDNIETFYYRTGNYDVLLDLIRDESLTVKTDNLSFTYIVNDEYADIQTFDLDNNFDNVVFWVIDKVSSKNCGFLPNKNLKKLYDLSVSEKLPPFVKGYIYYYNENVTSLFYNSDTLSIPGLIEFAKNMHYQSETINPPWIFLCQRKEKISSTILINILDQEYSIDYEGISLYETVDIDGGEICVFKINYDYLSLIITEKIMRMPKSIIIKTLVNMRKEFALC